MILYFLHIQKTNFKYVSILTDICYNYFKKIVQKYLKYV